MLRVSQLPFKNFEYNIKRAQALARLDDYLEDILYNEGKWTIGMILDVSKEMMHSVGMDALMKEFEQTMKTHLRAEQKEKELDEAKAMAKQFEIEVDQARREDRKKIMKKYERILFLRKYGRVRPVR